MPLTKKEILDPLYKRLAREFPGITAVGIRAKLAGGEQLNPDELGAVEIYKEIIKQDNEAPYDGPRAKVGGRNVEEIYASGIVRNRV